MFAVNFFHVDSGVIPVGSEQIDDASLALVMRDAAQIMSIAANAEGELQPNALIVVDNLEAEVVRFN